MCGNFSKTPKLRVIALILIVLGSFLAIRLGILFFKDITQTEPIYIFLGIIFTAFSLMLGCIGIVFLMFNSNAYITADERGISAKFALYSDKYWSREKICRFEYVGKTLFVVLKDQKEYQIPFLENSKELYQYCKKVFPEPGVLPREELKENLKNYKRKQLQGIHLICILFVVLFADMIISAVYIGDTLSNLTSSQTWCFVAMVIVCTLCVILAFLFAGRYGKYTSLIRRTQNDLIKILAQEKAKEGIDSSVTVDVKYFDEYRYRISFVKINKNGFGEENNLYSYILWQFDLEKEKWVATVKNACFFESKLELVDYVYDLFSDVIFEETV